MAFYYQHVGEEMAIRDIPRSIGTPKLGPHQFSLAHLEDWFQLSRNCPHADLVRLASSGERFQVWGFPRGAERILAKIGPGDQLMLMGSKFFEVISEVVYRVPRFSDEASNAIWKESGFPIIVLLKNSVFITLSFDEFSRKLGFDNKYHMRGNTMKVGHSRLIVAGFRSDEGLANWCKERGQ